MQSAHRRVAIVFGTAALAALSGACTSDDGKPSSSSSSSSSSGSSGSDSGAGGADGGGDATTAKKKNAEDCTKDEECESGVCFVGGTQGYCSLKCDSGNAATVCVAPFTGSCNNKGFCKRD